MFKPIATIAAMIFALAATTAAAGGKHYFPAGLLDPSSVESDQFRNDWYSKHLEAMSEPILEKDASKRIYRLTWLRTFHHPVAIRIVAARGNYQFFATELSGAGGYEPGKVLRKKEGAITQAQFDRIEALIQKSGFWNLPTYEETMGLDGSEWIIEAAADKYHVVDRWTPESGPIREIGEQLISISGWEYASDDMY